MRDTEMTWAEFKLLCAERRRLFVEGYETEETYRKFLQRNGHNASEAEQEIILAQDDKQKFILTLWHEHGVMAIYH